MTTTPYAGARPGAGQAGQVAHRLAERRDQGARCTPTGPPTRGDARGRVPPRGAGLAGRMRGVETEDYSAYVERGGGLLARAAGVAGEGAGVPTCPGWTVGDLVRHTGTFHRWAARIVREGLAGPVAEDAVPDGP